MDPPPDFDNKPSSIPTTIHQSLSSDDGWQALGKIQLRRTNVSMATSTPPPHGQPPPINALSEYDLDLYAVAVAPHGGMIALVPKPRKSSSPLRNGTANNNDSHLMIFSGSGVALGRGPFPAKATLPNHDEGCVFWTESDTLCCVLTDGALLTYNVHGVGPSVTRILDEYSGNIVTMVRCVRNLPVLEPEDDQTAASRPVFYSNDESFQSSESQLSPDHGYTGVILLTQTGRLIHVEDVAMGVTEEDDNMYDLGSGDVEQLQAGGSRRILEMCVIPSTHTNSGSIEVLVSTSNNTLLRIDKLGMVDHALQEQLTDAGPIMKIALAPNGRFLACYTSGGQLKVFNTQNLSKSLLDFDTKSGEDPLQVVWAGIDAVVLRWRQLLLAVGPYGHWIRYSYDLPLRIAQECDSCRVITNVTSEIIQRVPEVTVKTFEMGSTEPSALLFAANQAFHNQEAKADEDIRSIVSSHQLDEAMMDLLDAARYEFSVHNVKRGQKKLLQAVSYGSGFYEDNSGGGNGGNGGGGASNGLGREQHEQKQGQDGVDKKSSSIFSSTSSSNASSVSPSQMLNYVCRQLRVLNSLRATGLPMTYGMFQAMTAHRVVDRLITLHRHAHAVRVCTYLRLDPRPVLVHWACAKVQSERALNDIQLHRVFLRKLGPYKNISYRKIAKTAAKVGRSKLAELLLDAEPIARIKVSTLCDLGQLDQALEKAVKCRDSNLIYSMIFAVQKDIIGRGGKDEEWFPALLQHREASSLLLTYLREEASVPVGLGVEETKWQLQATSNQTNQTNSADVLSRIYKHLQWYAPAGHFMVNRAYRCVNVDERIEKLRVALQVYELGLSSKVTPKADKESLKFQARALSDQIRLLTMQVELEEATGNTSGFIDLSVMETISSCIHNATPLCIKYASRIKNEFQINDKRFYLCKINALSSMGAWGELKRFSEEKRSPVGYVPFVEAYIAGGRSKEAAACMALVRDEQIRIDLLEKNQQYMQAAVLAIKLNDKHRLIDIYRGCTDKQMKADIVKLGEKIGVRL